MTYLENHDQVANSARGFRLKDLASPGCYRAMAALWLLAPQTPMLFQGQELGTSRPFVYFSDHVDPLASQVRQGRGEELSGFRSTTHPELAAFLPDPGSSASFLASKLESPGRIPGEPRLPSVSGSAQAPPRGSDLPGPAVRSGSWRGPRSRGVRAPLLRRWPGLPASGGEPGTRPLPDAQLGAAACPSSGHGVDHALVQRASAVPGLGHSTARAREPLAARRALRRGPGSGTPAPRPEEPSMGSTQGEDFDVHPCDPPQAQRSLSATTGGSRRSSSMPGSDWRSSAQQERHRETRRRSRRP